MSKATHTPGPWEVSGQSRALVRTVSVDEYGRSTLVARCETVPVGLPDDVQAANAAFIVTACNAHDDLLAACEAVWNDPSEPEMSADAWDKLRAAIAKAKGGAA